MTQRSRFILVIFLLSMAPPINAKEEHPSIVWSGYHNSDFWTGLKGSLTNRLSYLSKTDLRLEFNLERLLNLKTYSFIIEGQNINGDRPNLIVHSFQGFDNIEYDRFSTMTYLYQFFLTGQLNKQLSILAGIYDINTEFYVTNSTMWPILPTWGTGTDLAQTGMYGPSTFPVTGAALRLKYTPSEQNYFQGAILDAAASNPLNRASPYMPFSTGNGVLGIVEIGHLFSIDSDEDSLPKIAIGAWGYSQKVNILNEVAEIVQNPADDALTQSDRNLGYNRGIYGLLDYPLFISKDDKNKVLHGVIRGGTATTSVNTFYRALGAGLSFNGFVPKRSEDILFFGVAPAWTSERSRAANPSLPVFEFQAELSYVATINSHFIIQPDLIYLSFPQGDPELFKNTFLAGVRFTLTDDDTLVA